MSRRPPAGRIRLLLTVLVLGLGGIGARVSTLHVRDAEAYEALARDQRVREVALPAARGSVFDRNGHELAISLDARAIYANPQAIERPGEVAGRIAPLIGARRRQIARALDRETPFVYLARRVDLDAAEKVEALGIPGIGLLEESKRYYPSGTLASQVLGFVGVDGDGLEGIELAYDRVLAGRPGTMVVEQDPEGRPIPQGDARIREPVPGESLVLTIDRDLQWQAQRALERAVRQNGAKGGTVVVLDPSTGDVLAMVTYPWFDANEYTEASPEVLLNRAVTDVYEPGSVNKVITAAAALEDGAIGLGETIDVPGAYRVGDKVFRDIHPHGLEAMTLSDIIAESSNVGTIRVAERLGRDRLAMWLTRFGFGRETGIDFPGESEGILLDRDDWWVTSMGTIPMGQGIAVTPLQMASVYATVASGGVKVRPRLVRGTIGADERFEPAPPGHRRRVIGEDTARAVREMLVRVIEEGTGGLARVEGYEVGGKTGTARKPLEGALGYSEEYVASFIGFAPADEPRIVVAAMLDEPDTVYGGVAAAPLFREVTRYALADLQVPPTEPG
ncbi:MAG TPA: penicillin-binding protein 2 [Actinomycetota bacterium]|nr:penicillin-binding protein 2 [Actinomycetota bacterium]